MGKNGKKGFARLVAATRYSWQGFVAAFRYEEAFRQEFTIAVIGFVLAIFIAANIVEFLLLVVPLLLMLLAELLNSAIEAVVDRTGEEHHELSGRAKDMGSAATFVSFCIVGLSWILILYSHYGR